MKSDFRRARCKLGRAGHLAGKDLKVEAPAIVGKSRDVALEGRIAGKVRFSGEGNIAGFHASADCIRNPRMPRYFFSRSS